MQEDRRCATCANWVPTRTPTTETETELETITGNCHRYAPQAIIADSATIKTPITFWPVTTADDFCGEWYYGGTRIKQKQQTEEPKPTPIEEEVPSSTVTTSGGFSPKRPPSR